MVEKWMQSKGSNPYMNKVGNGNKGIGNPYGNRIIQKRVPIKRTTYARYGMPVKLFKDSDKDGVPNVFDCKPFNKRKQDVMAPQSGGSPMMEMYARREANRQQQQYNRQLAEYQRLEEERIKELQRISGETTIQTVSVPFETVPVYYNYGGGTSTKAATTNKTSSVGSVFNTNTNTSTNKTVSVSSAPKTTTTSNIIKTVSSAKNVMPSLASTISNAIKNAAKKK